MIPKAQYPVPLSLKICSAFCIVSGLLRMLSTVKLDDQFTFSAEKICDVRPDWRLTPKLEAVELAAAQLRPQLPLCVG